MKKILVLCTGNSCRSQILEGWLRHFSEGQYEVYSAGIEAHGVNPDAIFFMNEVGVDITHHTSDLIDEYLAIEFDLVTTVCNHAKESCPVFPSTIKSIHCNFEDPSKTVENQVEAYRRVIEALRKYALFLRQKIDLG